MPSKNFSIWNKELTNFLHNLHEKGIDTSIIEDWFAKTGSMEIHRGELATLTDYLKHFYKKHNRFPDLSGVSLQGYMLEVLNYVKNVFLTTLRFDKQDEIFEGR